MDSRAVSPVVEKTVAIALVALFVSGLGGTLLAGTVPDYGGRVGEELGDRVLASAARSIESAVPASEGWVDVRVESALPGTIDGEGYRLELRGRSLRLVHPNPGIGARTRLALPPGLAVRNSSWTGGPLEVRVRGSGHGRWLAIAGGAP